MLTIPFFTKPNQTNWEKYAFMTLGRQKLCKLCKLCKFQLSFSKLSTFRFSIFSLNFGVFFVFWKSFTQKALVTIIFDYVTTQDCFCIGPFWTQKVIILLSFLRLVTNSFHNGTIFDHIECVDSTDKFGPKQDPNSYHLVIISEMAKMAKIGDLGEFGKNCW